MLVPRGGAWGERAAELVRARGGVPEIRPLISITQPENKLKLTSAVHRWNEGEYDWLAVTSANAVTAITEVGAIAHPMGRTAAVGPATAAQLREHGFLLTVQPAVSFTGADLAKSLLAVLGPEKQRIFFPASEIAGDDFERALRAAGHTVDRVVAYRTEATTPDPELAASIRGGDFDAILVTSGSVAKSLADVMATSPAEKLGARRIPRRTAIAAIGEPSATALREAGLRADVTARSHTIDGMLDALAVASNR